MKKRARIILCITLAWLLLLIVGSLQPARLGPGMALHRGNHPGVAVHRGIHWLAFAGTALLLLLLSRNRRQEICSAIGTFLLGLSLEYLQHLIYRKPMEWRDVADDILAVLAAFALYQFTRWRAGDSMPPVGPG